MAIPAVVKAITTPILKELGKEVVKGTTKKALNTLTNAALKKEIQRLDRIARYAKDTLQGGDIFDSIEKSIKNKTRIKKNSTRSELFAMARERKLIISQTKNAPKLTSQQQLNNKYTKVQTKVDRWREQQLQKTANVDISKMNTIEMNKQYKEWYETLENRFSKMSQKDKDGSTAYRKFTDELLSADDFDSETNHKKKQILLRAMRGAQSWTGSTSEGMRAQNLRGELILGKKYKTYTTAQKSAVWNEFNRIMEDTGYSSDQALSIVEMRMNTNADVEFTTDSFGDIIAMFKVDNSYDKELQDALLYKARQANTGHKDKGRLHNFSGKL